MLWVHIRIASILMNTYNIGFYGEIWKTNLILSRNTHNIGFYGEIWKIILKLSRNTLLICSTRLTVGYDNVNLYVFLTSILFSKFVFGQICANSEDPDQTALVLSWSTLFNIPSVSFERINTLRQYHITYILGLLQHFKMSGFSR